MGIHALFPFALLFAFRVDLARGSIHSFHTGLTCRPSNPTTTAAHPRTTSTQNSPLSLSFTPHFTLALLNLGLNQLGNILRLRLPLQDIVHRGKQRKLRLQSLLPQERINLIRRARTLQLLPIKHLLLDLKDRLPPLHRHLGTPEVPPPATRRDDIRDAARLLCERRRLRAIGEELLAEFHHLEDAHAHDGGLRVVAPAEAVDEASGKGDDVLEGAAEGDAGHVVDDAHVEVGAVEELADVLVGERRVLDGEGLEVGGALAGDGARGRDEVDLGGHGGAAGGGGAGVHGRGVIGDLLGLVGGFFFLTSCGNVCMCVGWVNARWSLSISPARFQTQYLRLTEHRSRC